MGKLDKAAKDINKKKIKGVSAKVVTLPSFTEEQKKRIKKMRAQLRGVN
jgi:hypothetical protein